MAFLHMQLNAALNSTAQQHSFTERPFVAIAAAGPSFASLVLFALGTS